MPESIKKVAALVLGTEFTAGFSNQYFVGGRKQLLARFSLAFLWSFVRIFFCYFFPFLLSLLSNETLFLYGALFRFSEYGITTEHYSVCVCV